MDNLDERVDRANRRVAEARGECLHYYIYAKPGRMFTAGPVFVCKDCGKIGSSIPEVETITNYASGPSEFLTLLGEIKAKLKKWGVIEIEICNDIGLDGQTIFKVEDRECNNEVIKIYAPTLPLAVTEAWNEVFGKCKACKGSGAVEVSECNSRSSCPKCKGTGQGLKGGKDNG